MAVAATDPGILCGDVFLGRSRDLPWGNVALCEVDLSRSTMLRQGTDGLESWAKNTARARGAEREATRERER